MSVEQSFDCGEGKLNKNSVFINSCKSINFPSVLKRKTKTGKS